MEKKFISIDKNLTKKTRKYLKRLQREESKFYIKLSVMDSGYAKFAQSTSNDYGKFITGLTVKGKDLQKVNLQEYSSRINTLETSLAFLDQFEGMSKNIKLPSVALDKLKANLNQTGKVQAFIGERRQLMKDALAKYRHLPPGLQKQYEKINKTAYYYKAQVQEYKNILKDPQKIEATTLKMLNKIISVTFCLTPKLRNCSKPLRTSNPQLCATNNSAKSCFRWAQCYAAGSTKFIAGPRRNK